MFYSYKQSLVLKKVTACANLLEFKNEILSSSCSCSQNFCFYTFCNHPNMLRIPA